MSKDTPHTLALRVSQTINEPYEPYEPRGGSAGAPFWLLFFPLAVVASIGGAVPLSVLLRTHDSSGTDAAGMGAAALGQMVVLFWMLLLVFAVIFGGVYAIEGERG